MEESEQEYLQPLNSLDCWDYSIELECLEGTQDLQLAAELGKTLLERNKELEISLKQQQNVIEDQTQEIEYLTKQTVALREVSDSRLRIYEQLEVSIQDLERANHRLVVENSSGKKHVKSLTSTIEGLEVKCEDLQTTIDELRLQIDVLRKKTQKPSDNPIQNSSGPAKVFLRQVDKFNHEGGSVSPESKVSESVECRTSSPKKTDQPSSAEEKDEIDSSMEQISQLLAQLRESKTQSNRDQRRIAELEEQLSTMIQQNQALENQVIQLHHRDDDMKSMYDELSTLEEVRKGQMCSRCLRNVDMEGEDVTENDSDPSLLEALSASSQHHSSFSLDVQDQSSPVASSKECGNLYKDMVMKYEALVQVYRHAFRNQKRSNCLSLQEELQMSSDFNVMNMKDTDEESGHGDSLRPEKQHNKAHITFSHTPTDFSEAETSSSGFADETSNKYTQTEERTGSSFGFTAGADDSKVSIYDDASPISSRFKDQPEYQELFTEIITALKNKPEDKTVISENVNLQRSEQSSVLESTPIELHIMTPGNKDVLISDIKDDDSQSVVSSTMSELSLSQNEPTTIIENIIQAQNQSIPEPEAAESETIGHEHILKPLVRQPLEYLSVEVRKRSTSRRKNKNADRSDSPMTHIIGSPKINFSSRLSSGRKRRGDIKNNGQENDMVPGVVPWNGSTLQFWSSNRNIASPTPSQGSGKGCFEFKPSSASQDLHKLKKLDLSYAEVLRNADSKKMIGRQRRK